MAEYTKPLPVADPVTQPYWDSVKAHALKVQKCNGCGRFIFYPRVVCPHCFSRDLQWTLVSGRGTVYGFTISYQKTLPAFASDVPYVIAMVELDEGVRLMTNLVGVEPDPTKIRVGMEVVIVYDEVSDTITLPKFMPVIDETGANIPGSAGTFRRPSS